MVPQTYSLVQAVGATSHRKREKEMRDCRFRHHHIGVSVASISFPCGQRSAIPNFHGKEDTTDLHRINDDSKQLSCWALATIGSSENSSCSIISVRTNACMLQLRRQTDWLSQKSGDYNPAAYTEDADHKVIDGSLGDKECAMCGDVGIPEYLFKCIRCEHRYQHMYCNRFYPHNVVFKCNWCQHQEDMDAAKQTLDHISRSSCKDEDSSTPPSPIGDKLDSPLPRLSDHGPAFEYLLQIVATRVDNIESNSNGITSTGQGNGLKAAQSAALKDQHTGLCRPAHNECTDAQPASKKDQNFIHRIEHADANVHEADNHVVQLDIVERPGNKMPKQHRSLTANQIAKIHRRSQLRGDHAKNSVPLRSLAGARWRREVANTKDHGSSLQAVRTKSVTPIKSMSSRRYKLLADVLC